MARVMKEYEERKKEILDAAQTLFYQNGYEKTSVNAIIESIGISKGTFYHYFRSKEELLDSLGERLGRRILEQIEKSMSKPGLDAIAKFNIFLDIAAREKAGVNKKVILVFLEALHSDGNVRLRDRIYRRENDMFKGLLSDIIRQGVQEGVFDTPFPEELGEAVLKFAHCVREKAITLLLELPEKPENLDPLMENAEFFTDALERMLGAPKGSLKRVDRSFFEAFLTPE